MKSFILSIILLVVLIIVFDGCKKDTENHVQGMALASVVSGKLDMDRQDTVRGVSSTLNIVITFTNSIDFTTITKSTVRILRDTVRETLNFVVEGKTLTIDPVDDLLTGSKLKLILLDSIQSTNGFKFAGDTINFFTEGVGIDTPPQSEHQILYVQFNGGISDVTLHDSATVAYLSYGVDRFGIANEAGNFSGGTSAIVLGEAQNTVGNIVELLNLHGTLIPPSITISVWLDIPNLSYRSNSTGLAKGVLGLAGERGYYLEIVGDTTLGAAGGPKVINISTDHLLKMPVAGHQYYTSVESYSGPSNVSDLLQDGWHQVVITYDAATSAKTLYIDSLQIQQWILTEPTTSEQLGALALNYQDTVNFGKGFDQQLALGFYLSKENTVSKYFFYETEPNTFIGMMDDLRMYDIALTEKEVWQLYRQERARK